MRANFATVTLYERHSVSKDGHWPSDSAVSIGQAHDSTNPLFNDPSIPVKKGAGQTWLQVGQDRVPLPRFRTRLRAGALQTPIVTVRAQPCRNHRQRVCASDRMESRSLPIETQR